MLKTDYFSYYESSFALHNYIHIFFSITIPRQLDTGNSNFRAKIQRKTTDVYASKKTTTEK